MLEGTLRTRPGRSRTGSPKFAARGLPTRKWWPTASWRRKNSGRSSTPSHVRRQRRSKVRELQLSREKILARYGDAASEKVE
jgi:hypothetical protein